MPHATESDTALSGTLVPVEVRGKLRNRFYEPIILLLALTQAWKHNHAPKVLDHASDVTVQSSEQLFRDFMNKLAQICDSKPKGSTVTAAVALRYNDHVQYRFASNDRNERELEKLKSFIEDILNSLSTWTVATNEKVRAIILRKIVAFNRLRLQAYVRAICTQSQECLKSPENSVTNQTRQTLKNFQDLALQADDREADEAACECNDFESAQWDSSFVKSVTTYD